MIAWLLRLRLLSTARNSTLNFEPSVLALAVGQSGRYIGTAQQRFNLPAYYQVDAQTRTGIKVSAFPVLSMKKEPWNMVEATVQIQVSTFRTAWQAVTTIPNRENLYKLEYSRNILIILDGRRNYHIFTIYTLKK